MPASLFSSCVLLVVIGTIAGQMDGEDLTTPFASLPGMTTQQVLRSILAHDAIPYSAVVADDNSTTYLSSRTDDAYRSSIRIQNRGMDHLYTFINMFVTLVQPKQIVPKGECR